MRVRDYNRHEQILKLLKEETSLDIKQLTGRFGISLATARRDLTILEKEGKLLRTFGGARAKDEPSMVIKTFGEKRTVMNAAKLAMARAALKLISPGMKLTLDSGTTIWTFSRLIRNITPLTIITHSLAVIEEIGGQAGITLFCIGGKFRPANLDFHGHQAQAALAQFAADIAFISVDRLIPERGGYAADQESASMLQAMSRNAAKRIVMVDHAKIGSGGLVLAVENKNIDVVITDDGISPEQRRQLIKQRYKLIVAEQIRRRHG
jgi:DeoR family transcriptional regulator of aga operon